MTDRLSPKKENYVPKTYTDKAFMPFLAISSMFFGFNLHLYIFLIDGTKRLINGDMAHVDHEFADKVDVSMLNELTTVYYFIAINTVFIFIVMIMNYRLSRRLQILESR